MEWCPDAANSHRALSVIDCWPKAKKKKWIHNPEQVFGFNLIGTWKRPNTEQGSPRDWGIAAVNFPLRDLRVGAGTVPAFRILWYMHDAF